MTADEVSDFPEPDSPMSPTRSPAAIEKFRGWTRVRDAVEIVRSVTVSSGSVISFVLSASGPGGRAGRRPAG